MTNVFTRSVWHAGCRRRQGRCGARDSGLKAGGLASPLCMSHRRHRHGKRDRGDTADRAIGRAGSRSPQRQEASRELVVIGDPEVATELLGPLPVAVPIGPKEVGTVQAQLLQGGADGHKKRGPSRCALAVALSILEKFTLPDGG